MYGRRVTPEKGEKQMRVLRTILGMLLLTIGLPALLVGAGFWAAMQHRDAGGAFSGALQDVSTPGYAVVVDDLDALLHEDAPFARVGDTRLRLTAYTPDGPAFVGIAPAVDVRAYLDGVSRQAISKVDLGTGALPVASDRIAGTRVPPSLPSQETFWSRSGNGQVDWSPAELRGHDYSLVIMNQGAQAGLQVQSTAELRPGWLNSFTWALLLLGSLVVMVAMIVLAWPGRRREVIYVVEPSQVPDLIRAIGAPSPLARTGGGRHTGAHRLRTLAESPPQAPPALPQYAWPPTAPSTAAAAYAAGASDTDAAALPVPAPGEPLSLIGGQAPEPVAAESSAGTAADRSARRRSAAQPDDTSAFEASAVGAWVAETAAARARDTEARAAAVQAAEAARIANGSTGRTTTAPAARTSAASEAGTTATSPAGAGPGGKAAIGKPTPGKRKAGPTAEPHLAAASPAGSADVPAPTKSRAGSSSAKTGESGKAPTSRSAASVASTDPVAPDSETGTWSTGLTRADSPRVGLNPAVPGTGRRRSAASAATGPAGPSTAAGPAGASTATGPAGPADVSSAPGLAAGSGQATANSAESFRAEVGGEPNRVPVPAQSAPADQSGGANASQANDAAVTGPVSGEPGSTPPAAAGPAPEAATAPGRRGTPARPTVPSPARPTTPNRPPGPDPASTRPGNAGPAPAQGNADPASTRSGNAGPATAQLANAEPANAGPAPVQLANAEPANAGPGTVRLANSAQADAEPGSARPIGQRSGLERPTIDEPAAAHSAAAQPRSEGPGGPSALSEVRISTADRLGAPRRAGGPAQGPSPRPAASGRPALPDPAAPAGSVRVASPEPHIAEQRVAAHRPPQPDAELATGIQGADASAATGVPAASATEQSQSARLAAYADEAAELLAGSYPAKKKRRTPSEVAADEASSKAARSAQKDRGATDSE
jgi:hypothetical protein